MPTISQLVRKGRTTSEKKAKAPAKEAKATTSEAAE